MQATYSVTSSPEAQSRTSYRTVSGQKSAFISSHAYRAGYAGSAAYLQNSSDSALLAAIAAGDSRAFWRLWSQTEPDLYRVCLAQMDGNHADAEDALSAMRLKAFEALSSMAATINLPRAWLIRSTRNLCRDIRRGSLRRTARAIHIDHVQQEVADPRRGVQPEPVVIEGDSNARMRQSIDRLPVRLRDAAVLRFVEEQEYDEIALRLDITEVNARKRVQEARAKLRKTLGDVTKADA